MGPIPTAASTVGVNLTTRKEQTQLVAAATEEEVELASLANSSELTTQGRGPMPRENARA